MIYKFGGKTSKYYIPLRTWASVHHLQLQQSSKSGAEAAELPGGMPRWGANPRLLSHCNCLPIFFFHFLFFFKPAEEISTISCRGAVQEASQRGRNIGRLGASEAQKGKGGSGHGRRSEASLQGKRDQELFWRRMCYSAKNPTHRQESGLHSHLKASRFRLRRRWSFQSVPLAAPLLPHKHSATQWHPTNEVVESGSPLVCSSSTLWGPAHEHKWLTSVGGLVGSRWQMNLWTLRSKWFSVAVTPRLVETL